MERKLTKAAIDKAAQALAVACNGGVWETDYTERQRDLWRKRVMAAMAVL